MPIQVKPKHHPRIATLVAQAKANDPERTWTSALLAEYVNEHYGDGIKFHTGIKDKGSLTKHMTTKKLVDDDAKVGRANAYGVTNLADVSMGDLTQPLYEDQHDRKKLTGWASVCVDWSCDLPGRNFRVHSRRFKTQRKAYVHAVSMLAHLPRHEGQADKIDFAAVDPNDDKLRDDVLAAVQEMGARTEAEPWQEPRRDIYPGVSAVKMERDGTRVVYAAAGDGKRERFLLTDIEAAKTFAGLNERVQRLAQNAEVLHEVKTNKITQTEAAVGMRAPSPAAPARSATQKPLDGAVIFVAFLKDDQTPDDGGSGPQGTWRCEVRGETVVGADPDAPGGSWVGAPQPFDWTTADWEYAASPASEPAAAPSLPLSEPATAPQSPTHDDDEDAPTFDAPPLQQDDHGTIEAEPPQEDAPPQQQARDTASEQEQQRYETRRALDDGWRVEGSPYLMRRVSCRVLDETGTTVSHSEGFISGWLDATRSGRLDSSDQPAALWHVYLTTGELAGDEIDLELHEVLDSLVESRNDQQPVEARRDAWAGRRNRRALDGRPQGRLDAVDDDTRADGAAAPREESVEDVVAERDALRKRVEQLGTVLAALGIQVDASTGAHTLDLSGITLGPVGIDEAEDARAREYIPEELKVVTQAFQPILDVVQGDHEAFFECIPGFRPPDDFRLKVPAHWAEVLGQTSGTFLASTVLLSKAFEALDDNWTFDEVRDEVNRLARASGLFAQFVDRRLGCCLPNCPEADDYRDECWTLDFMIHGLEGARAAGLVLRPTAFADHWEDNMNYSQMVRYYYAGRVCTAVTSSSQASVNHRGRQRGGVGA